MRRQSRAKHQILTYTCDITSNCTHSAAVYDSAVKYTRGTYLETALGQADFYHTRSLQKVQPLYSRRPCRFERKATGSRPPIFSTTAKIRLFEREPTIYHPIELRDTCSSEQQTHFRYPGHAFHGFRDKNSFFFKSLQRRLFTSSCLYLHTDAMCSPNICAFGRMTFVFQSTQLLLLWCLYHTGYKFLSDFFNFLHGQLQKST